MKALLIALAMLSASASYAQDYSPDAEHARENREGIPGVTFDNDQSSSGSGLYGLHGECCGFNQSHVQRDYGTMSGDSN